MINEGDYTIGVRAPSTSEIKPFLFEEFWVCGYCDRKNYTTWCTDECELTNSPNNAVIIEEM